MPAWSSPSPNSRPEQSMPKLSTPRNLPILILKLFPSSPGGNSAPTMAQGILIPTLALGAPHTICNGSAERLPTDTLHTLKRSASGCWVASKISATTTDSNGGASFLVSSTSNPAIVIKCSSASVVMGGFTNCLSHDSQNCILTL